MKKSDIKQLPEYFDYYINLSEDIELEEAFNKSLKQIDAIDVAQLNRIGLKAYEDGKWSINKIMQHLIDWERIWCYRTMLFARQEGTVPAGHDQDLMGQNSNADELSIEQLIAELKAVRLATKAMFESYNRQILEINCKFYNYEMSVLAMGFNIIGHQLHHLNIIKERYIPLDN
ncbi:MAG TPA: DinB family protein [Salinimicrobium sp.]|nr:DinB family protein [Salinimicrobium sp.]